MTTTTLRPNATITAGSVTGAASAHAATSDDSDSSFVATGTVNRLDFTTVAMGSGAVTKSGRIRVRHGSASGGIPFTVTAGEDVNAQATGTASDEDGIQTATGTYAQLTITQARLDALELTARATAGDGTNANLRFYELYFDLIYVTQPVATVTAVSPDPYTASNVIPIAWSNTLDSDGGGQTRYWLKVFTDAQYSAGGFDPETSTPYYDSSVVVSGATSANTAPLETGDTYRAYVKVAQTVNGVLHWSAWAFDTFAVDVDTADVDSVTAVADDATAKITVTVERDTGSEAWALIEVQRSIDGGGTWSDVRGATYVDATGDANTFTIDDYETGNDVDTLYRARATRIVSDLPITGAWAQTASAVAWQSDRLWVKSPTNPSLNATFLAASTISPTYSTRRGVYNVLGRPDPVVISDVRSTMVGSMALLSDGVVSSAAIAALIREPIVLAQPPPAWSMDQFYASLGDVTQIRGSKVFQQATVWASSFIEVTAPSDPDAGR